jgi:hypothetical protein
MSEARREVGWIASLTSETGAPYPIAEEFYSSVMI